MIEVLVIYIYVCAGPIRDEPWFQESLLLRKKIASKTFQGKTPIFISYSQCNFKSLLKQYNTSRVIPKIEIGNYRQLNNNHGIGNVVNERRTIPNCLVSRGSIGEYILTTSISSQRVTHQ